MDPTNIGGPGKTVIALLRDMLIIYWDCFSQQTIIRSDRGRPLSPNSSWDFNVSHDGNFTVFVAQKATDESSE